MEAEIIGLILSIAGVAIALLGMNINALKGLRKDIKYTNRCNSRMKRQMLLLRSCIIMKWGDEPKVVEMLNDEWHKIDE